MPIEANEVPDTSGSRLRRAWARQAIALMAEATLSGALPLDGALSLPDDLLRILGRKPPRQEAIIAAYIETPALNVFADILNAALIDASGALIAHCLKRPELAFNVHYCIIAIALSCGHARPTKTYIEASPQDWRARMLQEAVARKSAIRIRLFLGTGVGGRDVAPATLQDARKCAPEGGEVRRGRVGAADARQARALRRGGVKSAACYRSGEHGWRVLERVFF